MRTRSASIVPSSSPGPAASGTNAARAAKPQRDVSLRGHDRPGRPSSVGLERLNASSPNTNTSTNPGSPSSPNTPSNSQQSASAPKRTRRRDVSSRRSAPSSSSSSQRSSTSRRNSLSSSSSSSRRSATSSTASSSGVSPSRSSRISSASRVVSTAECVPVARTATASIGAGASAVGSSSCCTGGHRQRQAELEQVVPPELFEPRPILEREFDLLAGLLDVVLVDRVDPHRRLAAAPPLEDHRSVAHPAHAELVEVARPLVERCAVRLGVALEVRVPPGGVTEGVGLLRDEELQLSPPVRSAQATTRSSGSSSSRATQLMFIVANPPSGRGGLGIRQRRARRSRPRSLRQHRGTSNGARARPRTGRCT